MQLELYAAYLVVGKSRRRLTRSMARQFPILPSQDRFFAMEQGEKVEPAIAKTLGRTLGHKATWLYLIPDAVAGYAWVPAHTMEPCWAKVIEQQGGYVDAPERIPTVIL